MSEPVILQVFAIFARKDIPSLTSFCGASPAAITFVTPASAMAATINFLVIFFLLLFEYEFLNDTIRPHHTSLSDGITAVPPRTC